MQQVEKRRARVLLGMSGGTDRVKVRYRKQQTIARVMKAQDGLLKVHLSEPVEAIAPGQTAVFYRDNLLLGGGFII